MGTNTWGMANFAGRIASCALLAVGAAVAASGSAPVAGRSDAGLRAQIEQIASRRIFFGHQSVGANLLDGVERLAAGAGATVRVAELRSGNGLAAGTFGHVFVGENRKPLQKLQAFERALASPNAAPDIALIKFCYLDIDAHTDAGALFATYRSTIEALHARMPGTTIVHVTTPLTTVQGGPKAWLKQLLGRAPYGVIENERRDAYNQLLRQAYAGREPIFDLARIESTAPDGSAARVQWKDHAAPVLVGEFTDDGSHLNEAGRLRAARELIAILAAVPDPARH